MQLPPHPISSKEHVSVIAMLCGAEGFVGFADFGRAKEPWLRTFLRLPNGIVTNDAMGAQKQIAREISEAGADYVPALKGKQKNAALDHSCLLSLLVI